MQKYCVFSSLHGASNCSSLCWSYIANALIDRDYSREVGECLVGALTNRATSPLCKSTRSAEILWFVGFADFAFRASTALTTCNSGDFCPDPL